MTVSFDKMPGTSRVWVYQADRPLEKQEIQKIEQLCSDFTAGWEAHGKPLQAAFSIQFNQFLILAVDESQAPATGCSIDSSVKLVRELEQLLTISFLDRSKIAVLSGDSVRLLPFNAVKSAIAEGAIEPGTKVVNNSVNTLSDWEDMWIQPAAESWMKRYF